MMKTIDVWQDWGYGGLKRLGTVQREIVETTLKHQADDRESKIVTRTVSAVELFPGLLYVVTNLGLDTLSVTIGYGREQVLPEDMIPV